MYKYEFCPAELITHCIGEGGREGGKVEGTNNNNNNNEYNNE